MGNLRQPTRQPLDEIWGDEIPTLREITEEDWGLIEHLAEISTRTGDVDGRNTTATAERARQLLEMPGAAILSLICHLTYLRRVDLVDALEVADRTNILTDEIITRKEYETRRERLIRQRQEQGRRLGQARADRAELDRVWLQAQADPEGTITALQALWAQAGVNHRQRLHQAGALLGLAAGQSDDALQRRVDERQLQLIELCNRVQAPPEPQPEPDPGAALRAEALDWQPAGSTVLAALDRWRNRGRCDQGADWRRWFRHSDFHHPQEGQAIALIASAVGATVAEVEAHARVLGQRHADQLAAVREAWSSADQLLADAVLAGSWEALAIASGVSPDNLLKGWQELAAG